MTVSLRDFTEQNFQESYTHSPSKQARESSAEACSAFCFRHCIIRCQNHCEKNERQIQGVSNDDTPVEAGSQRPVRVGPTLLTGGQTLLGEAAAPDGIEKLHG